MKRTYQIILLFLNFLLLVSPLRAQELHEWDVNESETWTVNENDSVKFINYDSDRTFSFRASLIRQNEISLSLDTVFLVKDLKLKYYYNNTIQITYIETGKRLELKLTANQEPATTHVEPHSSIVHDAIEIKKELLDTCFINKILEKYDISSSDELKANSLLNGIIRDYPEFTCEDTPFGISSSSEAAQSSNSTSGIGGLDVTKYADGLTKFLIKRTKEELAVSFFQEFKTAITDTKNKDFVTVFPSTAVGLQQIDTEIYYFQRYIGMLREQAESDIHLLPENFRKLILSTPQATLKSKPDLKAAYLTGIDLVIGIRDKSHPGEIINSFDASNFAKNPSLEGAMKTLQLLSTSMHDTQVDTGESYWVEKSTLRKVLQDPDIFQIYLGLLVQKSKQQNITFSGPKSLADELLTYAKKPLELRPYIEKLMVHASTINALIKADKESDSKLTFQDASRYFLAINQILGSANGLLNQLGLESGKAGFDDILFTLDHVGRLYNDIVYKRYSSAVLNLGIIYEYIFSRPDPTNEKTAEQLKLIKKYGAFMATLLQAENSDDVASVIEAYALPSGSSIIKRKSHNNISLNAYLGPYLGRSHPISQPDDMDMGTGMDMDSNTDSIFGLTIPVGIAFSRGNVFKNGSLSLFFSLLDLGAIAEFRFKDDTSEVSKIFLREIFSPGAFISYGFGNTPLSLNAGIQRTSYLTSVGTNQNIINSIPRLRYSVSLNVDIPLLNFRTRETKKIKAQKPQITKASKQKK